MHRGQLVAVANTKGADAKESVEITKVRSIHQTDFEDVIIIMKSISRTYQKRSCMIISIKIELSINDFFSLAPFLKAIKFLDRERVFIFVKFNY